MIRIPDYPLVNASTLSTPQPLSVLLLLDTRLDRDAYSALLENDHRFSPVAAPSASTAERILTESGTSRFAVLMGQSDLSPASRELLGRLSPEVVVVLRDEGSAPPRSTNKLPLTFTSRDAPWRTVASLLSVVGDDGTSQIDPASETASNETDEQHSDDATLASLTRRERQVLEHIAAGASVRECAESLGIANSTVDNHKSRLMRKLGVRKSSEVVRFAFRVGIAP